MGIDSMPKTFGFWFIAGVCLLSFPLLYFFVWDPVNDLLIAMELQKDSIEFDSGSFYYLLITVFWLFLLIEIFGHSRIVQKHKDKLSLIIIGWFAVSLIISFMAPYTLNQKLDRAGYSACTDPSEISRISPGRKLIYKLKNSSCK